MTNAKLYCSQLSLSLSFSARPARVVWKEEQLKLAEGVSNTADDKWSPEAQKKLMEEIGKKTKEDLQNLKDEIPVRVVQSGDTLGAILLGMKKGGVESLQGKNIWGLKVRFAGADETYAMQDKKLKELQPGDVVLGDIVKVEDDNTVVVERSVKAVVADGKSGKVKDGAAGPAQVEKPAKAKRVENASPVVVPIAPAKPDTKAPERPRFVTIYKDAEGKQIASSGLAVGRKVWLVSQPANGQESADVNEGVIQKFDEKTGKVTVKYDDSTYVGNVSTLHFSKPPEKVVAPPTPEAKKAEVKPPEAASVIEKQFVDRAGRKQMMKVGNLVYHANGGSSVVAYKITGFSGDKLKVVKQGDQSRQELLTDPKHIYSLEAEAKQEQAVNKLMSKKDTWKWGNVEHDPAKLKAIEGPMYRALMKLSSDDLAALKTIGIKVWNTDGVVHSERNVRFVGIDYSKVRTPEEIVTVLRESIKQIKAREDLQTKLGETSKTAGTSSIILWGNEEYPCAELAGKIPNLQLALQVVKTTISADKLAKINLVILEKYGSVGLHKSDRRNSFIVVDLSASPTEIARTITDNIAKYDAALESEKVRDDFQSQLRSIARSEGVSDITLWGDHEYLCAELAKEVPKLQAALRAAKVKIGANQFAKIALIVAQDGGKTGLRESDQSTVFIAFNLKVPAIEITRVITDNAAAYLKALEAKSKK